MSKSIDKPILNIIVDPEWLRKRAKALKKGPKLDQTAQPENVYFVDSIQTFEQMFGGFRGEVFQAILRFKPDNIDQLATAMNKKYANVHLAVKILEKSGVIFLKPLKGYAGSRPPLKPIPRYVGFTILPKDEVVDEFTHPDRISNIQ